MTNQTPTFHVAPDYKRTLGGTAYEFGASFGITLDPWQRVVMDDWLALDDNGKWACSTCGLSVPRQNGKTALVKVRVMLGIFSLGETILFTCHEVRTSRQVFDSLADILNPNGLYPDLAAQVQYIKRSNGYEEIKAADWQDADGWHKGGKLLFSSRSNGASRGFTADVVVADEAMYMTDEQVAALVPTMASASGGDMQFIMLGTPPSPTDVGTVFKNTRNAAKRGESGISWCEWGADEIGDIHDWQRIERFNPSLGNRLMRKAVESELSVMAPDTFAHERLGLWSSDKVAASAIDLDDWDACATTAKPGNGVRHFAVKFSPDGAFVSLAVCVADSTPYLNVIKRESMRKGVRWLVDWLSQRANSAASITIDGASAQFLIDKLQDAGVDERLIVAPKSADVASACGALLNALAERNVVHYEQTGVNEAVISSKRRAIGRAGWGFGGEGSDMLESLALAYKSALDKKKPKQRMMVAF